jgi:uncharacterized protein (TIGR00255 family)
MIQSMTGYAASTAESPRGTLALELRSVNSRFLDVQMRTAEELRALEPMLRERISERIARGKVDCRLFFVEGTAHATELNESALAQLKTLSKKAQKAFPKSEGLRVADILRWPGVVAGAAGDEAGGAQRGAARLEGAVVEPAGRRVDGARDRPGERRRAAVRSRATRGCRVPVPWAQM